MVWVVWEVLRGMAKRQASLWMACSVFREFENGKVTERGRRDTRSGRQRQDEHPFHPTDRGGPSLVPDCGFGRFAENAWFAGSELFLESALVRMS